MNSFRFAQGTFFIKFVFQKLQMEMTEITSFIIGYILGSFPTAYLMIKKKKNIDITANSSGNSGALNSYKVTDSKLTGIVELLVDLLKGLISVLLVKLIFGENFVLEMIGLIGAVFAHCFSPWLKFKGGRGLATAGGGSLLVSIPVILIWIVIWAIAMAFRRNVHFGNFTATFLTGLLSFSSANVLIKYSQVTAGSQLEFGLLVSLMMLIILLKHIQPMKKYLQTQNQKVG